MNQQPFFKLNEPLSEQDAMVSEYKAAPEKANPFVKFFAEIAIVQDAETETPQYFKNTEAAVTGKISTSNELLAGGSIVNQ